MSPSHIYDSQRKQDEHLRLLRERNALAAELCAAQDEAAAARRRLERFEAQLAGASGFWWRPIGEQLARTLASGSGSSGGGSGASPSSGGSSGGGDSSSTRRRAISGGGGTAG